MTRHAVFIGLVLTGLLGVIPAAFGESDKPPTQQELQERITQLLERRAGQGSEAPAPEGRAVTLPMRRAIPLTDGLGSPSIGGLQRRQLTEGDLRAGPSAVISLPRATIQPRQLSERDFLGNRLTISGSSSAPTLPRRQLSERDFLGRR